MLEIQVCSSFPDLQLWSLAENLPAWPARLSCLDFMHQLNKHLSSGAVFAEIEARAFIYLDSSPDETGVYSWPAFIVLEKGLIWES